MDTVDNPVYEPLPGETKLWNKTTVIGLFEADFDTKIVTDFLDRTYGSKVTWKVEQLEDKDWVREWMNNFHPLQCGTKLWICPSWCEIPHPEAVNVMLDPGLAFGTGTHPTTFMCLNWLDSLDLTGKEVVDFGCGSGILAVSALKLGAASAIGIDIDPQAIDASEQNASRNGVAEHLKLYLPASQPLRSPQQSSAGSEQSQNEVCQELPENLSAPHGFPEQSSVLSEADELHCGSWKYLHGLQHLLSGSPHHRS